MFDGSAGDCTVTRGGESAAIRLEVLRIVVSTVILAASGGLLYVLFGPRTTADPAVSPLPSILSRRPASPPRIVTVVGPRPRSMSVVAQAFEAPASGQEWLSTVVLAVVGLVGAATLVLGVRESIDIYRTDPVDVATAPADERVELEGTVEPVREELAPIAGRSAVLYETEVQRKSRRHRGGRWETAATESVIHPFLVDDGTGSVLVDTEALAFWPGDTRQQSYLIRGKRPPEEVCDRLDVPRSELPWSAGVSTGAVQDDAGFGQTPLLRFEEFWLEPGETVHLRGVPRRATVEDRQTVAEYAGDDREDASLAPRLVLDESAGQFDVTRGGERAALRQAVVVALASAVALLVSGRGLYAVLVG